MGRVGLRAYAIVTLATVQAGGAAPTALYHLYQDDWNLSAFAVTVVFAAYPLSLLLALLTLGPLSDYVGRRPVLLASLALSASAMILFIFAAGVTDLVIARAVQGIATGMAAATIGAVMLDLDRAGGALVNSVTAFMGTSLGVLGSGALVAFAPAPRVLVYIVALALFLAEGFAALWMPRAVERKSGALASLRPALHVPLRAQRQFALVSPVNVAGWALGGFYLSLGPALLRQAAGFSSPFVTGGVVAALTLAGAGAMVALRGRPAHANLVLGACLLALGMAVTVFGVWNSSITAVVLGTLVAGAGFGASFFGAGRTILPLAEIHERAGLLSSFYLQSYLAFSLPALLMGLLVPHLGLSAVAYAYGGATIILAFASIAFSHVQQVEKSVSPLADR